MKKILVGLMLVSSSCVFAENDYDFVELDEPYQYVTGAYWGITVGPTFVKNKLVASNKDTNESRNISFSKTQFDFGLMAGFGTSFYKDYYVGLEMEMLKRTGKGVHYKKEGDEFGLRFQSQFGLNMNVRFGYLFPKQGNMVYVMVGFSRTLGKAVGKDNNKEVEQSFGSYFPIIGIGIEHKINYDWNIRLDAKYSITSKDSEKRMYKDAPWIYEAKPQSVGIRLSITRNI